jgi:hypothetical protein
MDALQPMVRLKCHFGKEPGHGRDSVTVGMVHHSVHGRRAWRLGRGQPWHPAVTRCGARGQLHGCTGSSCDGDISTDEPGHCTVELG